MSKEVQMLLKNHSTAFRSDDMSLYSTARAILKRGFREAKIVWQGIQHITNYQGSNNNCVHADASLAEQLNCFFSCFKINKPASVSPPPLAFTTTHSHCRNRK